MNTELTDPGTLYCANHPDRETFLRCNSCEKPICVQCAVQTPTGYRCRECVRGQQKKFNTAKVSDLILAPLIAAILSFVGSNVANFLRFFILLIAPFVGMAIEQAVRLVIKNRRSQPLYILIAAGTAVGSLPLLISDLLLFLNQIGIGGFNLYGILPLVWQGAFTVLVTSSVYYRLKGITFK